MGLACTPYRATSAEIDRLIQSPDTLQAFYDERRGPAPAVREVKLNGFLGFLLRLTPITVSEVVSMSEADGAVDAALRRFAALEGNSLLQ
jgi:hypothetical protein